MVLVAVGVVDVAADFPGEEWKGGLEVDEATASNRAFKGDEEEDDEDDRAGRKSRE